MTARVVNVHAVPSRGDVSRFKPETRSPSAERLGDRIALVLVAAAERGIVPERWGLGLALLTLGSTVLDAWLVVADDLCDREPERLAALEGWAARQCVATPNGPAPLRLATRSTFCHPTEGPLLRHTYRGGAWLVTADEGRSLGLLADWWGPARGRFAGGFVLGLPGCGHYEVRTDARGRRRSGWRADLHTPPLRAKPLADHGLQVEWGRAGRGGRTLEGEPAGHWEKGKPYLGRVVDLIGPAVAIKGRDCSDLSVHLRACGLAGSDVPAAVTVTVESAERLVAVARSVHALALALDAEDARWLVTEDDLRAGRATVGLRDLYSGGSLARRLWSRSGATPPLAKFAVPDDDALDAYAACSHGGWCTAEVRAEVVPALDADMRQAYPAAACLAGIHQLLFATALCEVDRLERVQALSAAAAAGDWRPFLERSTYERLALTRCRVLPQGEQWPVELPGRHGPRLYVRRVTSREPIGAAFGDVMLASFLAGQPVTILSATGLVPMGREAVRPVPLRDGITVAAGSDPVAALVRLRPAKGTDERLRAAIRGIANPAAWGVFARLDQQRAAGQLAEEYAAWSWPPIPACIPAIVRMWLAMVDRAIADAGGTVISRDTDGFAVLASPMGTKVPLADGRVLKALSWTEVESMLRRFDALDPFGDGGASWSVEREAEGEPLHLLALGRKRYLKVRAAPDRFEVVDGTEHALGGGVADPPGWGAEHPGGQRRWVGSVHTYALARATGPDPGWRAPWDEGTDQPFPVLRRYAAGSPDTPVPAALGLHPFGPWIEAEPDKVISDRVAVALDPGDDLAGWAHLAWFDRDGTPVRVGTANEARTDVVARTLADYAWGWAQPVPPDDEDLVEIDPRLVRRVGRGGALIDAQLADPEARAEDHQVLYGAGDPEAFVAEQARRLGPRPFARLTGVSLTATKRLIAGRPVSDANVERALKGLYGQRPDGRRCALDNCGEPVSRPNARYCTKAHRDASYRKRRAQRTEQLDGPPVCASCGSCMLGSADTGTGVCIDCGGSP